MHGMCQDIALPRNSGTILDSTILSKQLRDSVKICGAREDLDLNQG